MKSMMCINCLVCGEPVPVEWIYDTSPRICQKCKDAIMVVRRTISRAKIQTYPIGPDVDTRTHNGETNNG